MLFYKVNWNGCCGECNQSRMWSDHVGYVHLGLWWWHQTLKYDSKQYIKTWRNSLSFGHFWAVFKQCSVHCFLLWNNNWPLQTMCGFENSYAAKLPLRNILRLAASLLSSITGWLIQCVEMFAHKRESRWVSDNSFENMIFCLFVCISGCSTEETLGGPKCNSSTLLLRTDAELHHSSGNSQFIFVLDLCLSHSDMVLFSFCLFDQLWKFQGL